MKLNQVTLGLLCASWACLLLSGSQARADETIWDHNGTGAWDEGTNWDPGVPDYQTDAFIRKPGPVTISGNIANPEQNRLEAASLLIAPSGSGTVTHSGNKVLRVYDDLLLGGA